MCAEALDPTNNEALSLFATTGVNQSKACLLSKSLFHVVFRGVVLALFSWLCLHIGLLIKLDGPKNPAFMIAGDPRIAYAGKRLRKLGPNGLPQFIKMFCGDMDWRILNQKICSHFNFPRVNNCSFNSLRMVA